MRSRRTLALGALLSAALVSGCSLAPRYRRPAAPVSPEYPATTATTASGASVTPASAGPVAAELGWRDVFGDARLQAVVALALRENRDLRVAALNVELARALYGIQRSELFPTVAGSGSVTRAHTGRDLSPTGESLTSTSYTVGVGTTAFELDLFGRVRSLKRRSLEEYLATEEAHRSAHLALVSEVASQYLFARALDSQVALARQTLETVEPRTSSRAARSRRARAPSSTSAPPSRRWRPRASTCPRSSSSARRHRTRSCSSSAARSRPTCPSRRRSTRSPRWPSCRPGSPPTCSSAGPTSSPPSTSSSRRTPASARRGRRSSRPSRSPRSAGRRAASCRGLFSSGSGLWSFAPRIDLPIFTGGRNKANLDGANVRKSIQVARYEQAIQVAFREVADALVARGRLEEQLAAQTARVEAEQRRYVSPTCATARAWTATSTCSRRSATCTPRSSSSSRRGSPASRTRRPLRALGGGWRETGTASAAVTGAPPAG